MLNPFNYIHTFLLLIWQMTKLAIIPFTVLLETVFLKKNFRFNHTKTTINALLFFDIITLATFPTTRIDSSSR